MVALTPVPGQIKFHYIQAFSLLLPAVLGAVLWPPVGLQAWLQYGLKALLASGDLCQGLWDQLVSLLGLHPFTYLCTFPFLLSSIVFWGPGLFLAYCDFTLRSKTVAHQSHQKLPSIHNQMILYGTAFGPSSTSSSSSSSRGGPFCHISLNIRDRLPVRVMLYALCHKKTENIFLEIKFLCFTPATRGLKNWKNPL